MELGKEEGLDGDYSGKPLGVRSTAEEVAAAYAADPRRARYGVNTEAMVFEDGTEAVRGHDGKWYVKGSDGWADLDRPVEFVRGRWVRIGDDDE